MSTGVTLTVVIPALDEEEAIGDTIERCLAARREITENSGVDDVEIIVVSDGSTDATEEIACGYPEVTVLAFEQNRGYGAAIKCGFEHGRGELVGFLDADGTCDPRFFAPLCRALEAGADVALGSRLGKGSRMPWLRAVGNTIFAVMLGLLSRSQVRDTASGMRVLQRACLSDLYPLPDGLHFTPAMTAGALLAGKLKLVEVPMSYAERVGASKLSVVRDGLRFFRVIAQAAMCYRPARPLLFAAALLAAAALAVGFYPVGFYLGAGRLEEWMIYRILLASLLSTGVALLLSTAVVAEGIAAAAHGRPLSSGLTGKVAWLFTPPVRRFGGLLLLAAALALAWPGMVQYLTTGAVDLHWSRAVLAALLLVLAGHLAVSTWLLSLLELIRARHVAEDIAPPQRIRRARPDPP